MPPLELLILLNEPIDKFILDSLYTNYEIKIKFSIKIKTKDRVEISSIYGKTSEQSFIRFKYFKWAGK